MRPSPTPSTFFAADQEWQFRVRTWDTPHTTLENDTASSGMRLRVYQPIAEDTNWTAYANAVKGVAAGTSPETQFTSTTYAISALLDNSGNAIDGRWPLIQAYWGSGTPNWWGGAKSGRVAVSFSGTLVPAARRAWLSASDSFTFALAGSGWARIDAVDGATRTTLFIGDLSESIFLSNGFLYSKTATLTETTVLHVYYVQTPNEPWGGLVVKAIPGSRPIGLAINDATTYLYTGTDATHAVAQAAPVVSAGLFSHGAGIAPVELPFIMSVNVSSEPGAATRAQIEVPLVNATLNDGHGWVFYQPNPAMDPGSLRIYDGGQLQHTLKRKRLIQVQVARKGANPSWSPLFTGHVEDFGSGSSGKLTIECVSFEGRMVEQFEQAPDRISYMARGYKVLDYSEVDPPFRKQPVYNVPAFDNWPLAGAIEELGMRAGIDPSCFRKPLEAVQSNGTGVAVTFPEPLGAAQRFQAASLSGEAVRLPRAAHYGNVGLSFTEDRPFDDEYLFQVEPTKDLWARARELSDKLGYVCRFDTTGAAVLYPAASPSFVRDLAAADAISGAANITAVINPGAYGAKYLQVAANQAATLRVNVRASRIDVSFPRGANLRSWTVTVTRVSDSQQVYTGTVNPTASNTTPELFFGATVAAPGTNSTVFTAYSGDYAEYQVTLAAAATANVALVDCIIAYAQDPDTSKLPTLSTVEAAESVVTLGQQDAVRNKITIVGRRKGAVTDSDKFAEAQAPTEQEFIVQNAVDVNSIVDPTATNYVGYLKQSVIYDESIADDGLARYLAQVFIYRQSVPRMGTSVSHTLLPMLELGDPVSVEESKYDTASATTTQYVRKLTHQITANKFKTNVETEAWPDYPAYQPRTDINLADFDNKPVTGLSVAYTSLSGHAVNNPSVDLVKPVARNLVEASEVTFANGVLNATTMSTLPWPPVPGTFQVRGNYNAPSGNFAQARPVEVYFESPHQAPPGARVASVQLGEDWYLISVKVALFDGTSTNYPITTVPVPEASVDRSEFFYYQINNFVLSVYRGQRSLLDNGWVTPTARLEVRYFPSATDFRRGWLANSPYHRFFDIDYKDTPTTARVQLPWEQITGLAPDALLATLNVRYVSLFPTTSNVDPNGALVNGVNFSPFYDPYTSELGHVVTFKCSVLAEGLYRISVRNWEDDTVVAWLTNPAADALQDEQHWEYIPVMADKQFTWDGVDQLGTWNAAQSELYSQLVEGAFDDGQKPRVGRGFYCWNQEVSGGDLGPLAYIWMARYANNYAEVAKRGMPIIGHGTYARWYVHIEAQTTTVAEPEVSGKDEGLAILTHLTEPTKLELKIEDYNPATQEWETPTLNVDPANVGAYINNAKPVRIRFRVAKRPGQLWTDDNYDETEVKLTREVHLRAVIADQFILYNGKEFADTKVEDRTIVNRRLVNDDHTKRYIDSGYRKAKTLRWDNTPGEAITEWEFRPSDFKKDFMIAGLEESIEFGNYLQLEEVPQWNSVRQTTAARSRLQMALMSYLFYLSAFVTDRSGRSSWGINRNFVDKSKIYINTQTLDWPIDPMYEQRRTVVCRQWTDETAWKTQQRTQFGTPGTPLDTTTLFNQLLESFWYQYDINSTTIGTTPFQWSAYGLSQDPYSYAHTQAEISDVKLPSVYGTSNRQLGSMSGGAPVSLLGKRLNGTIQLGSWEWEQNPTWIPSITRDFHPFFRLPPMMSPPRPDGDHPNPGRERDYVGLNSYWTVGGPKNEVTFRGLGYSASGSVQGKTTIKVYDAAGAETWSSPVVDYTDGTTGRKRFWPGFSVNIKEKPFTEPLFNKTVPTTTCNYVRQDEMVHYEDIRGVFSRGSYPTGQAIKVAPSGPYYLNPFRYRGIEVYYSMSDSPFALFHVIVDRQNLALGIEWFRIGFRSEYVVDSGSMYPTTRAGAERLDAVLWWKTRYTPLLNDLYYDYGAWAGWKDDRLPALGSPAVVGGRRTDGNYTSTNITTGNPFTTSVMPVGVGPVLPQTAELVTHLVLLPERRGS